MFVGCDYKIVVQSTPRTSNPLQLKPPANSKQFSFPFRSFSCPALLDGTFSSPAYVCKVGKNESTEVKEAVKIL